MVLAIVNVVSGWHCQRSDRDEGFDDFSGDPMWGATTSVLLHLSIARGEGIRWGFAAENLGFLLHRRDAALRHGDWNCDFSWESGSKAVNRGVRRLQGSMV